MDDFYTTKLLVEVEVKTQFGPDGALSLVKTNLIWPAVTGLKVLKAESNFNIDEFRVGSRVPSKDFIEVPIPEWVNKPIPEWVNK